MSGFLQIIVEGNLGSDPVMSEHNGQAVVNFSMAVNITFPGRDGNEPKENVTWIRVNAWGPQAEAAGQYLSKGREVLVIGRLVGDQREGKGRGGPRIWQDPETGAARTSFEVRAQPGGIVFVGGRDQGNGAGGSEYENPTPVEEEDEIPF